MTSASLKSARLLLAACLIACIAIVSIKYFIRRGDGTLDPMVLNSLVGVELIVATIGIVAVNFAAAADIDGERRLAEYIIVTVGLLVTIACVTINRFELIVALNGSWLDVVHTMAIFSASISALFTL